MVQISGFPGTIRTANGVEHTYTVLKTAVVTAFEAVPSLKNISDATTSDGVANLWKETRRLINRSKKKHSNEYGNDQEIH